MTGSLSGTPRLCRRARCTVIYYVDNFLGFPAGTNVPVGAFARDLGQWRAEDNGIVLTVTGVSDGVADLDVDGDALADDDVALGALGIELDERTELGQLYASGSSLWRIAIPHFTEPYDCNWGSMFPEGAGPPPEDPTGDNSPDSPEPPLGGCEVSNASSIECEMQILRESIPIAGTEFSLNYSSDRVPGRRDYRTVRIPLSGASVPEPLKRIDLEVQVGGTLLKESFPPGPSQFKDFTWDGQDGFERFVQGTQEVKSTVRFAYDGVYGQTSSFASVPGVALEGSRTRNELYMTRQHEQLVGMWDARAVGLGGWTLNVPTSTTPTSPVPASSSSVTGVVYPGFPVRVPEAEIVVDLQLAYEVALELQALVENDPLLAQFRTGVAELVENSRRVLAGDLSIGELRNRSNAQIPSREAAERIVHIVSRMPGPDGTEEPQLLLALARLHGNVVDAVMNAVFAGYPEVVRAFPIETVDGLP